jgi:hypothetical protein
MQLNRRKFMSATAATSAAAAAGLILFARKVRADPVTLIVAVITLALKILSLAQRGPSVASLIAAQTALLIAINQKIDLVLNGLQALSAELEEIKILLRDQSTKQISANNLADTKGLLRRLWLEEVPAYQKDALETTDMGAQHQRYIDTFAELANDCKKLRNRMMASPVYDEIPLICAIIQAEYTASVYADVFFRRPSEMPTAISETSRYLRSLLDRDNLGGLVKELDRVRLTKNEIATKAGIRSSDSGFLFYGKHSGKFYFRANSSIKYEKTCALSGDMNPKAEECPESITISRRETDREVKVPGHRVDTNLGAFTVIGKITVDDRLDGPFRAMVERGIAQPYDYPYTIEIERKYTTRQEKNCFASPRGQELVSENFRCFPSGDKAQEWTEAKIDRVSAAETATPLPKEEDKRLPIGSPLQTEITTLSDARRSLSLLSGRILQLRAYEATASETVKFLEKAQRAVGQMIRP